MSQVVKLVLGVVLGLFVGLCLPEFYVKTLITLHLLVAQVIGFTIPLLIVFFVGEGIASLPKSSGHLLGKTLGSAYASTILAGGLAYGVSCSVLPYFVTSQPDVAADSSQISGFFELVVPPLFDVMTALALAFLFGMGTSVLEQKRLRAVLVEGREVIDLLLAKVIIPLLPVYISGVFAQVAYEGTVWSLFQTFGWVFLLILTLHWAYISLIYTMVGLRYKRSPWSLIKTMLPAYFTAVGTMSSAATIPVTLKHMKQNQVRDEIAHFMAPLCASIHLSGSVITLITCAMAVMLMQPELPLVEPATMLGFIMMLGIAMIAAPGAPGGGVMSAVGLLTSILGFHEAAIAVMIALYLAQDSFGTACNVLGDGALALWVQALDDQETPQEDALDPSRNGCETG